MTVHSLETAREIVVEDPEGVVAVYEYTYAISGEWLWSVEHWTNCGATLTSSYVVGPKLVYDQEEGWRE
jgi:hypothetical protein